MISVKIADQRLKKNIMKFPAELLSLERSYGRILAENIHADRDYQPADIVQMDGFALNFNSWRNGNRSFLIESTSPAGMPGLTLENTNNCIAVMTGALLPKSTDCVVPIEEVKVRKDVVSIHQKTILKKMQFVRTRGNNFQKGNVLIKSGCRLNGQEIAILASVGKHTVRVTCSPKIAIIGTGDELVPIKQRNLLPHQFRLSNTYTLDSILKLNNFTHTSKYCFQDNKTTLLSRLKNIQTKNDVLIISGGVSMGKFDFVPEILKILGAKIVFHKVSERPGKPLLFALSREGKPIFGLPGNPVSSQICFYRYVLPFLENASGLGKPKPLFARLDCSFNPPLKLTYFLPVRISSEPKKACLIARPVSYIGSDHFASLHQADGFVELPLNKGPFPKGFVAKFFPWKNLS